jgi:PIN domain nuclease of toxin-antitoxin system
MELLLDTNVLLRAAGATSRLNRECLRLLADRSNSLFLSAASIWEVVIKHSLGRLELPDSPSRWLPDRIRILGVQTLDVTPAHALALADLPSTHGDPFDRMLIAQANAEQLTLLTTDRIFQSYPVQVVLCGT